MEAQRDGDAAAQPQPHPEATPDRPRNGTPTATRSQHRGSRPSGQRAAATGIPRAAQPGQVPAPEHHHLPGWVRRAHMQARPVLADLLGHLEGEQRQQLQQRIDELTAGISAGKFSLAWQYPQVVEEGKALFEQHRSVIAERQKAQRALETARRKVADQLRDAGATLPADANARLNRDLRSASTAEAIAAVEAELGELTVTVRSSQDRRRDREIERTRARIARSSKAAPPGDSTESWQDVLRRLAAEQGER